MDPTQLQPGYRLDRYELLCPLAYGGMASVWLARFGGRLGFERMVVIKMILPQYSQDPRFKEMFLDEARIASKIEHSNVARILDVGEEHDNYFIVMEWVDGDSLSKILREVEQRKEKVPSGIAMRVIADAAAGLHAAHELKARDGTHLGVVHRDVSPQNILVANNGTTMIIDFGVAKARDRLSQETSAGQLKGKIRYMAPEQALGRPVDHRADVWALGAMLYEMFVGGPPYDGPNEVATLHKLTSGQRPQPVPSNVPAVIRSIIERALGYEPEERFSSALELNLALESAMVEINEPTTSAIVAAYTADLLHERKSARRDAVDAALEKARKRDERRTASAYADSGVSSTAGVPSGSIPTSSRFASVPPPNESSVPSRTGEREAPSYATLGSANMEYLPDPAQEDSRKRRYVYAATLGVSLAAGVIGILLIFNSVGPARVRPPEDPPPVPSVTTPIQSPSAPTPTPVPTPQVSDQAPAPLGTPPLTAPPLQPTGAPTQPVAKALPTSTHRSTQPPPVKDPVKDPVPAVSVVKPPKAVPKAPDPYKVLDPYGLSGS